MLTTEKDRCDFCKRLSNKLTRVNDYDFACESCGNKVLPVQVRRTVDTKEVVETVWRVPRRDGNVDRITYKGKRYRLMGGIRNEWKIYLS